MNWMNRLERKYGKYAIPGLMRYVIALYALGTLLSYVAPNVLNYLILDFGMVLHGQIWRLVTFLVSPPTNGLLFTLVMLYCYYSIGTSLEQLWGTFRFNLFFLMGMGFHILASIVVYFLFGDSLTCGVTFLNMSLFFAFVTEFPETRFLLFFIIPIKGKWLGYLNAAYFALIIIGGFASLFNPSIMYRLYNTIGIFTYPSYAVAALFSIMNYFVFYYMMRRAYRPSKAQKKVRKEFRTKSREAQAQARERQASGAPRHRCAVCGKTEKDDPDMEFRFCSKCDGSYEYCMDHLYTHKHVTKNGTQFRAQ